MVPYGSVWFRMVPYGSAWFRMVPYGSVWFRMVETTLCQEMCAPLARNHTFLQQKHRKPHAWIREQLSKSAHLPDPRHAGTKYPVRGNPSLRYIRLSMPTLRGLVLEGWRDGSKTLTRGDGGNPAKPRPSCSVGVPKCMS